MNDFVNMHLRIDFVRRMMAIVVVREKNLGIMSIALKSLEITFFDFEMKYMFTCNNTMFL
jgi:hypothetical protein